MKKSSKNQRHQTRSLSLSLSSSPSYSYSLDIILSTPLLTVTTTKCPLPRWNRAICNRTTSSPSPTPTPSPLFLLSNMCVNLFSWPFQECERVFKIFKQPSHTHEIPKKHTRTQDPLISNPAIPVSADKSPKSTNTKKAPLWYVKTLKKTNRYFPPLSLPVSFTTTKTPSPNPR